MAEDMYIVTEDADGHEIRGTYRVTDDIIRVTLSANGHSIREHLRGTAAEELAKFLLLKLDRIKRGVS